MIKRKIKRGNHRSTFIPRLKFGRTICGTIEFVGDSTYELKADKQKDTNKLIGLSDNWSHHKDSIRIGWVYDNKLNKFCANAIVYKEGTRSIFFIEYFEPNKLNFFQISITNNNYVVIFNEKHMAFDRYSTWIGPRVILQPYFGGTEVAPKDFNFEIEMYNRLLV